MDDNGRDVIYRQDVIDAVDKRIQFLKDDPVFRRKHGDIDLYGIKPIIQMLPPAQPERKNGKWVQHIEKRREYIGTVLVYVEYDYWFCDTCGYRVTNGQPLYNFCPNCGIDMRANRYKNEKKDR